MAGEDPRGLNVTGETSQAGKIKNDISIVPSKSMTRFGQTEIKIYYVGRREQRQKVDHISYIDAHRGEWYFQYWNEISIAERVKIRSRRYRRKKHLLDRL